MAPRPFSALDWDLFVHAVQYEDQTGTPLTAALRWLRPQAGNPPRQGPYATGAVEAVNHKLARERIA